jgi:signal transduction histidine kinase
VLLNVEMLHASLRPIGELVDEVARLAGRGMGARREEMERLGAIGARVGNAGEVEELLRDIGTAMRTITEVVRDLRVFARRAPEEEPELVDVHALVSSVLRIARGELASVAVVEQDFDPDLPPVYLPRSRLTQVLTNLLVNAAQAVREVERTAHRVRISTRHDEGGVSITITDTGPGIAFEDLERIFDPFYTTKPPGAGTGLGLSVSRELVRGLGGELLVESVPGEGASFAVLLPRAAPSVREPPSSSTCGARRCSSSTTTTACSARVRVCFGLATTCCARATAWRRWRCSSPARTPTCSSATWRCPSGVVAICSSGSRSTDRISQGGRSS